MSFKWKDYQVKDGAKGKTRHKTMTLALEEFMRRFLLHVLPGGFHRVRHYGLLASGSRKSSLLLAREPLHEAPAVQAAADKGDAGHSGSAPAPAPPFICRHCGHAMIILQTFARGQPIRAPPPS